MTFFFFLFLKQGALVLLTYGGENDRVLQAAVIRVAFG